MRMEDELLKEIDETADRVSRLVEKLNARAGQAGGVTVMPATVDGRWVSKGRTDLQTGFMALRRAVTRDSRF
jgi:hypothetical protein